MCRLARVKAGRIFGGPGTADGEGEDAVQVEAGRGEHDHPEDARDQQRAADDVELLAVEDVELDVEHGDPDPHGGHDLNHGQPPVGVEELHALEQHEEGTHDQGQRGEPAPALAELEDRLLHRLVVAAPDGVGQPADQGTRPGPGASGRVQATDRQIPEARSRPVRSDLPWSTVTGCPSSPHLDSAIVARRNGRERPERVCGPGRGTGCAPVHVLSCTAAGAGRTPVVVASGPDDDAATCRGGGRGWPRTTGSCWRSAPNRSSRTRARRSAGRAARRPGPRSPASSTPRSNQARTGPIPCRCSRSRPRPGSRSWCPSATGACWSPPSPSSAAPPSSWPPTSRPRPARA